MGEWVNEYGYVVKHQCQEPVPRMPAMVSHSSMNIKLRSSLQTTSSQLNSFPSIHQPVLQLLQCTSSSPSPSSCSSSPPPLPQPLPSTYAPPSPKPPFLSHLTLLLPVRLPPYPPRPRPSPFPLQKYNFPPRLHLRPSLPFPAQHHNTTRPQLRRQCTKRADRESRYGRWAGSYVFRCG